MDRSCLSRIQNWASQRKKYLAFYVATITDWPWEVAAYISRYEFEDVDDHDQQRYHELVARVLGCVYIWVRLAVIVIFGLPARAIVCVGRDRLDKIFLQIEESNGTEKYVECHEPSQLLSNFIIPAAIVLFLVIWVSWRTAFCNKLNCCLVNLDEWIKSLVDEIKSKCLYPDKCMQLFFTIIPVAYVMLSLLITIGNFLAFKVVDPYNGNVVMDWGETEVSGTWLNILISFSFAGFIAYDLVYIQLIMRYAFQCKMITYFAEYIVNDLQETQNEVENEYQDQNEEEMVDHKIYKKQDQDIKKLQKHLKQLNSSTTAVGIVNLLTAYRVTNCIINLVGEESTITSTHFQIAALAARTGQWVFLLLFTIFQPATTNAALQELRETRLAIYRKPPGFGNDESYGLNAKLLGITINPWFPFIVIFLMLFLLIVGPLGFKLLQYFL